MTGNLVPVLLKVQLPSQKLWTDLEESTLVPVFLKVGPLLLVLGLLNLHATGQQKP